MDKLEKAYLLAKECVARGYKVQTRALAPLWDIIVKAVDSGMPLYDACYCAAKSYERESRIGIDNAFSSIICELGVIHRSAAWYEIMAAHFTRQAKRAELSEEGFL